MELTYLGHSCFRIKGRQGSVVIDPYSKGIGMLLPKVKADAVLVSHDHYDHNEVSRVEDYRLKIAGPGEFEVSGIKITGISSFHDDVGGKKRGLNTIYEIEVDDIVVVHLGDLGTKLTDKQVEVLDKVDILLVPVGGNYTLDGVRAVEVVKDLSPSIVIPMHFSEKGKSIELAEVSEFIEKIGVEAKKVGNKVNIKKDQLGEELELLIMER